MHSIPVILIFDIGKTNKKLFLFDEAYKVVYESSIKIAEIQDEDGDDCEDLNELTNWILSSIDALKQNNTFIIKQIHYSAYGASFIYIDKQGKPILPLYNYLKPYNQTTKNQFEQNYGAIKEIAINTASPYLGNLNVGLQLYRIKVEQPEKYNKIKWALHLPQYLHYIVSGELSADITSIGCHTMLWNFTEKKYHHWVLKEGIDKLLPAIKEQVGLHDSSSALIPYLNSFTEPFVLISTGTWCISLNPFNDSILTNEELDQDALCYLSFMGKPIKAARLFSGRAHEQAVIELNKSFKTPVDYYTKVKYNSQIKIDESVQHFTDFETAYHYLVAGLVKKQIISTNLIMANSKVKRIFVDGGFSNNEVFMNLLAKGYDQYEVYAAAIPQASAIGAALAVHEKWNTKTIPNNLISLQYYSIKH